MSNNVFYNWYRNFPPAHAPGNVEEKVRGKNVQLDSQANGADVAGGSRPNIQTYNYTQTLKEFAKSMGLPSGSVMTTGKVVRVNVGGRLHFKLPDLITD